MKRLKYLVIPTLILFLAWLNLNPSLAATSSSAINLNTQASHFGSKAGFAETSLGTIIALIVEIMLGFLAVIFLVLIIFAGFRWMTAAGNEQQVEKSLATIKSAAIGLLIVLAAYSITYFVFNKLPFEMAPATNIVTSG